MKRSYGMPSSAKRDGERLTQSNWLKVMKGFSG